MLTIPRDDWESPSTLPVGFTYLAGQSEIGEGGYRHWQVVACFSTNQRLGGVKRSFTPTTHCEPTRSAAAYDYVFKQDSSVEGTRFQLGTRPQKRGDAKDWDAIWDSATRGALAEVPADVRLRYVSLILDVITLSKELAWTTYDLLLSLGLVTFTADLPVLARVDVHGRKRGWLLSLKYCHLMLGSQFKILGRLLKSRPCCYR